MKNKQHGLIGSAYRNGLVVEYLSATAIGGHQLSLFVKMQPTITSLPSCAIAGGIIDPGNLSLRIKLFDPQNNQTVEKSHATSLLRNLVDTGQDKILLIEDMFLLQTVRLQ